MRLILLILFVVQPALNTQLRLEKILNVPSVAFSMNGDGVLSYGIFEANLQLTCRSQTPNGEIIFADNSRASLYLAQTSDSTVFRIAENGKMHLYTRVLNSWVSKELSLIIKPNEYSVGLIKPAEFNRRSGFLIVMDNVINFYSFKDLRLEPLPLSTHLNSAEQIVGIDYMDGRLAVALEEEKEQLRSYKVLVWDAITGKIENVYKGEQTDFITYEPVLSFRNHRELFISYSYAKDDSRLILLDFVEKKVVAEDKLLALNVLNIVSDRRGFDVVTVINESRNEIKIPSNIMDAFDNSFKNIETYRVFYDN